MQTLTILALSWQHLLIVAIIVLILFGGKKIPEMMRGLGSGIKEFKDAVKEEDKKTPEETNSTTGTPTNNNSTPTN
ncbi:MAG TPA: twin-arginine translocase TatA/TatE family subunit [Kaistella chaponensis]|jgi:sec-independent protein translocase protein TatA|uniref:Sec-independent protein translocase subunit TatA/TatB n=1 Tax=Kaistella chaponensis TaxID=713588 RepID=UPI002C3001C6|nr:twin-arginine translocase TatA/TatE family subunit [Kaistella chaponensis]HPW88357.1 twin-arginine translocase TatA/TatE family subunit [Kaistella chaponensis]HQC05922.1 twin-arginine translocase TatA/TatE family subunit [Kaistella chaponensis]